MEFWVKYGVPIIMAICTTGAVALAKYFHSQIKQYKKMLADQESVKTNEAIEEKLIPIYDELEQLRDYIRRNDNIHQKDKDLIIASWRYRLIQLCREYLKQGYIKECQFEQLSEMYRLYTELGGNGQAQEYYDKVMSLPIVD